MKNLDTNISAGECFAELQALRMTKQSAFTTLYISDFTDNEGARVAVTKGGSNKQTMRKCAELIQELAADEGWALRTRRVTTTENSLSDSLSRGSKQPTIRWCKTFSLHLTWARVEDWSALVDFN